jgi:hypothetical protein
MGTQHRAGRVIHLL